MKKGLLAVFILSIGLCAFAETQYEPVKSDGQNEIYLDTVRKEYKLDKTDKRNNPTIEHEEDMTMPVNYMAAPLQMLKMYSGENY